MPNCLLAAAVWNLRGPFSSWLN